MLKKMKAGIELERTISSSLSGSSELESQKEETVECPARGEMTLEECLGHQSRPRMSAFSNPLFSTMWKACRSGCPNSFIGPDGSPIEVIDTRKTAPDENGFLQRIEHLIATQFKGNRSAFARATGVSPGGLKRYMSGGEPTLNKLISIAKGSKVNLLWLATGEGEKHPRATGVTREDSVDYTATDVDETALKRALETVDEALALANREVGVERKAGIVAAVYTALARPGSAADHAEVMRLIRSLL